MNAPTPPGLVARSPCCSRERLTAMRPSANWRWQLCRHLTTRGYSNLLWSNSLIWTRSWSSRTGELRTDSPRRDAPQNVVQASCERLSQISAPIGQLHHKRASAIASAGFHFEKPRGHDRSPFTISRKGRSAQFLGDMVHRLYRGDTRPHCASKQNG